MAVRSQGSVEPAQGSLFFMWVMRSWRMPAVIVALLCVPMVLLSSAVHAEKFYRWVDAQGVTHYGETAPKDRAAAQVKVAGSPFSDAEEAGARAVAPAEGVSQSGGKNSSAPAAPTAKAQNDALCEQHRQNLVMLRAGTPVRAMGDNGKPRVLSPDEVAAQISLSEGELKKCLLLQ